MVHPIMGTLGCLDNRITGRPTQSLAPGAEFVQEAKIPSDDRLQLRQLLRFQIGAVHASTVRISAEASMDGFDY